jgi:hemerythrin-like domain-containing protein
MNELTEEHKYGRKTVKELIEAKEGYVKGDSSQQETIISKLEALVQFYPNHIKKEDDLFFPNSEKYFSKAELEIMLKEFWNLTKR